MMPGKRPLSPHLQIYRPQLTASLSILHRITGFALSVGVVALVFWLSALATGGEFLYDVQEFWNSLIGKIFLLGWVFCFFYHLCNGIRHLSWDIGLGMDISMVYKSGWFVFIFSGIVTLSIWWLAGGL